MYRVLFVERLTEWCIVAGTQPGLDLELRCLDERLQIGYLYH